MQLNLSFNIEGFYMKFANEHDEQNCPLKISPNRSKFVAECVFFFQKVDFFAKV